MPDQPTNPTSTTPRVLEVCCGSADFAVAAAGAGADRVELCDNLVEGGTTPSIGAVALAVERCGVPVMAMIRPRGGDFLYSDLELAVMLRDIEAIRDQGAFGVVFGALRSDGAIDADRMTRLIDAARPMSVTCHRAFDVSRDLDESVDVLCELGVDRLLTSVGQASVVDHLDRLAALAARAGDRLAVMPCGGVRANNVDRVFAVPGIREVHIGASRRVPSAMEYRAPGVTMGAAYEPDEYAFEAADVERIRAVAAHLAASGQRAAS